MIIVLTSPRQQEHILYFYVFANHTQTRIKELYIAVLITRFRCNRPIQNLFCLVEVMLVFVMKFL